MGNSTSEPRRQETPVQSAGSKYREEANKLAKERNHLYDESRAAYDRKDHALAKRLSDQGKVKNRLMHEANDRASVAIYHENNEKKGRPKNQIDMHGLFVNEALKIAEGKIQTMDSNGFESLQFIVGQGIHSSEKNAKIKPAIIQLIEKYDLVCIPDQPNPGCVTVQKRGKEKSRNNDCTIL